MLIDTSLFKAPYPRISKNSDLDIVTSFIFIAQNESLKGILQEVFFDSIVELYDTEINISSVTVGATTQITLQDASSIEIGYFCTFEGLQGTISDVLNNKKFEITNKVGNIITIAANTTGKTYTASTGNATKILTKENNVLYPYLKDYLIYKTLALYIPHSQLKDTNSGFMMHTVGEAQTPNDKQLGNLANLYNESANTYEKRLVNFLYNNAENYPLYQKNETEVVNLPLLFQTGVKYNQGIL